MSEVKVNKISPRTACGTVTLGDSGDTFTIPSGATITNAGTASGFGATGETSWDTTVKTTGTFTATAGVGYFLNTTGGIITVNLPAGAAGSSVAMVDYARTWDTNAVTVTPNGSEKIGGVNANASLSTEGQSVTFVYIDGTQGWVNVLDSTSAVSGAAFITATVSGACNTLTTVDTDYKVATFLGPGTFCVSCAGGPSGSNTVDYLVVAGGASGGGAASGAYSGGGGGAGGFRESSGAASGCYTVSPLGSGVSALPVSVQGYPIVVGAGGAQRSGPINAGTGNVGSASSFSTIPSAGGGGGGDGAGPSMDGADGGSGGGSGGGGGVCGGTGNTPPVSPAQGKNGGNTPGVTEETAASGGGATAAGGNAASGGPYPTAGGTGAVTDIRSPTPATYSTGGAGGNYPAGGNGSAGAANTGIGGQGAGGVSAPSYNGGAGGSGIVVIRYKFQ
jgi:hypothetical protein